MSRRRSWTGEEVWQLYLRYPSEGPRFLAAEFVRSEDSINSMASKLRLQSLTRRARQARTRRQRHQLTNNSPEQAP